LRFLAIFLETVKNDPHLQESPRLDYGAAIRLFGTQRADMDVIIACGGSQSPKCHRAISDSAIVSLPGAVGLTVGSDGMISKILGLGTWRSAFAVLAAAVLLFPAIAMTVSTDIVWGAEDFLAAGVILAFVWLAIEMSVRLLPTPGTQVAAGVVAIVAAMTVWAHLAIGVF
jgi:hypothetical protein